MGVFRSKAAVNTCICLARACSAGHVNICVCTDLGCAQRYDYAALLTADMKKIT